MIEHYVIPGWRELSTQLVWVLEATDQRVHSYIGLDLHPVYRSASSQFSDLSFRTLHISTGLLGCAQLHC
ncbi:hypothetical protein RRG08_013204 [Elysia crispata]|uniref:Uncharacterized protein n=1 Tax=Elysia crispata TaxID=231223 RepID=A0AAE1B4S7_9GAST|nr:hypothetical protein RRG08_013204 [Elysia crispata]